MEDLQLKSEYFKLQKDRRLHKLDIPVIGLTGGIATGKSTVAQIFRDKKICVVDADFLIKEIYKEAQTIDFIRGLAPQIVVNNQIDFKKLRELFFNDKTTQTKIEQYLYPKMRSHFMNELEKFKINNKLNFVVYDVPLLFEKNLDQYVDLKILVYCPEQTQIERLVKRDNISIEMAKKILSHQINIEEKKKKCDIILENTKDLSNLKTQTENVIRSFLKS